MASPSPLFTINGGLPGVKASVAAGSTVTFELDDITGVTYVEWTVVATDETATPGAYTLSTNGGAVPGNETMTLTAGAAATGGTVRARINNGVNPITGNAADEDSENDPTIAKGKWHVPTSGAGFEVFVDEETYESDATHGRTGLWNQAIRAMGGGGAGAFTYIELGSGTKSSVGLIRMSRNFIAMACKTSASANHAIITEDNADGLFFGDSTQTVQITFDTKAAGAFHFRVAGSDVLTASATAINVAGGTSLQIAGVGHATAATNSSLAFRGTSGELSVSRLYGTGTVHTTAFLSYSRNGVILGCKTGGGVDHSVIAEDGSAGFVYGDATSTTKHTFKADGFDALVLNPGGLTTMGTSASGSIEILANSGEVITFDVGGDSYSFDEMGFSIPAGNTLQVGGVSMTSAATNSAPMTRDSSGRTQVSDPSVDADVATKGYVDGADRNSATEPTVIVASDRYVYVDGTVVNNITLPTATTFNGINLTLINTSDSIGDDITITSNGGQIIGIGGSAAIPLGFGYTMTLRGRASDWIIISTGTV